MMIKYYYIYYIYIRYGIYDINEFMRTHSSYRTK